MNLPIHQMTLEHLLSTHTNLTDICDTDFRAAAEGRAAALLAGREVLLAALEPIQMPTQEMPR